jgi:phage baseplate assembly protein W
MPYISLTINPTQVANPYNNKTSQIYKGFSTVDNTVSSSTLYDHNLIKQDLLNQLNISKGERVMDPNFGTVIWKLLFEPFTDVVKKQIVADFTKIINSDPRARAVEVKIFEQEYGLLMEATLQYSDTDQTEVLKLSFDSAIGLASLAQ